MLLPDEQTGREYCSRVCCMYATKLASLLKQVKPEKEIYIFYTDIRAYGKGFEEYYKKAQTMGIKYIRGKVAELEENPENKKVILRAEDTLSRQVIESEFDLVVLSTGLQLSNSSEKIINFLKLTKSSDGFLQEAHPKYKPVDTNIEGVFIAGTAQGPKDIPDTVAQASAAAARSMVSLAQKEFQVDPMLAYVHPDKCDGCGDCLNVCPKDAIVMNKETGKAEVLEALCIGCGACLPSCSKEALDFHGYTNDQMYAAIQGVLDQKKENETRIIIFADDTCTYRVADAVGIRKMKYSEDTRIIRVPSSSRISPNLMLYAFKEGADAIILGDCVKKSSRFPWSKEMTEKSLEIVNEKLKSAGIDGRRVVFSEFSAGALNYFLNIVNGMAENLKQYERIKETQRKEL